MLKGRLRRKASLLVHRTSASGFTSRRGFFRFLTPFMLETDNLIDNIIRKTPGDAVAATEQGK